MIFHSVVQIAMGTQLAASDTASRSVDQSGNPVDECSAGAFHSGRLHNMEFCVEPASDPQVMLVAVLGAKVSE